MYEQFKNDLLMTLTSQSNFSNEDIKSILSYVDVAAYNYEISKKETSIVVYNQELPYLVKTFIVCKSIEGFSKSTIYNYTNFLRAFFFAIQKSPEEVTTNDVRIYLYKYQQERNVSNRSLDKLRDCLSSFYSWLHKEGYIDRNPMIAINKIKYEKKEKVPCNQADLEYLRMSCKTLKQKAILEFLYSTGCRVSEVVILKREDVDWREKTVRILGKGKKYRTSFLNAKAEVALKEYLKSRTDDKEWLFVSDRKPHDQMHKSGIQKIIREIGERASDNVDKNISCHILRHTLASTMVANNADITSVQKILGHSNINTTMTYVHSSLNSAKSEHVRTVI